MPIINRIQGDLLRLFEEGDFDGIAHGCNCFHVMGAGIAGLIAKAYPVALEKDILHHQRGVNAVGKLSRADIEGMGTIYNLYTQFEPGRVLPVTKLYKDIQLAFGTLNRLVVMGKHPEKNHIGIPLIGAGIAGGNWRTIETVIQRATPDLSLTLVEYKAFTPIV